MNDSESSPVEGHPRPTGRPAVSFWWEHLLFMHWCVPVEAIRAMQPRIPPELEIDSFSASKPNDGSLGEPKTMGGWIGLVPFTMTNIRVAAVPGVPTLWGVGPWRAFHECNVRTYVTWTNPNTGERVPGVWFFSLDAASRVAVQMARRLWSLNYLYARIMLERRGDRVRYSVERRHAPRARSRCVWEAREAMKPARPGSLEWFLTERYAMFMGGTDGRPLRIGRIWHPQWSLRAAVVEELEDDLVKTAFGGSDLGSALRGMPLHVMHSDLVKAEAWWAQRV